MIDKARRGHDLIETALKRIISEEITKANPNVGKTSYFAQAWKATERPRSGAAIDGF